MNTYNKNHSTKPLIMSYKRLWVIKERTIYTVLKD